MATLVSFCSYFGDRMANLCLIDFKIGLHIKVSVNAGQILSPYLTIWPKWPSIGIK